MQENISKELENSNVFRCGNEETKFKKAIKRISKIVGANHFTYRDLKYIFTEVRKNCELIPPKRNKGIKPHLSQEEAQELINHAYTLKGNTGLLIKALLFTGTRVNEFVNIKVEDVYLQEKKIYISTAKGEKPRYVPIFDFYLHELMTYINGRQTGYLFESNRHTKYTTRRIQQIIKRATDKIGITKKITPHRLRATIATWLFDKGMPKDEIQLFLGHEKPETTQVYIKGSVRQIGELGSKILIDNKDNV